VVARTTLPGKYAGETVGAVFNFQSQINPGETCVFAQSAATVYSGTDPLPGSILFGAPSISSGSTPSITQALTGGVVGVIYNVKVTATTNLGQVLQAQALLAILPDAT